MSNKFILIKREQEVITILFNRPGKLNSMLWEMYKEIYDTLCKIEDDTKIKVVVLSGAGRAFSSGHDINELTKMKRLNNVEGFRKMVKLISDIILKIRQIPQPVIAKIDGVAIGSGLNIALACDIRICSEDSIFGHTGAKIGLIPALGGLSLLPFVAGTGIANYMLFTGQTINAKTAHSIRLVDFVLPYKDLDEFTRKVITKILDMPFESIKKTKSVINKIIFTKLKEQLLTGIEALCESFCSEEFANRLKKFKA